MKKIALASEIFLYSAFGGVLLLFSISGCSFLQQQTIAPGGVYSGDPFLMGVDQTLVETKASMSGFLSWAQDNKAALATHNSSVLVAAEKIRTTAPGWFTNAYNLRAAYLAARQEADPSAITVQSNALSSAISQLEAQSASTTAITNSIKLP